jgi:hypothetical protein
MTTNYDISQIKVEKRIIDGKEYEVKIVPSGMHGQGWKDDLFEDVDLRVAKTIEEERIGLLEPSEEAGEDVFSELEAEEDLVSRFEKLNEI